MINKLLKSILLFSTAILLSQCILVSEGAVIRGSSPSTVTFDDGMELLVIPQTYVYYISYDGDDVFFYHGIWWRPWDHIWYRAQDYSGPWIVIEENTVPYPVLHLPIFWRNVSRNAATVNWNDARDHWSEWERDKHWEKQGWRRETVRNNPPEDRPVYIKKTAPRRIEKVNSEDNLQEPRKNMDRRDQKPKDQKPNRKNKRNED